MSLKLANQNRCMHHLDASFSLLLCSQVSGFNWVFN